MHFNPSPNALRDSHKPNSLILSIWHGRPRVAPHELLGLFLGVWIFYSYHSAPVPRNTDWLNERIFTLSLAHSKSLIYDNVAATFLMKTSNANQRETEKEAQSMGASTAYIYFSSFSRQCNALEGVDRKYVSSKCILWFKLLETIRVQSLGSPTDRNNERSRAQGTEPLVFPV